MPILIGSSYSLNRLMMNHTVTFSGGGKDNSLYASLGYPHDGGWSTG